MIGDRKIEIVLAGLVVLLLVLVFAVARQNAKDKDAFMAECVQHRENYECVAMWRAGRTNTSYIPVVIPVR